MISINEKHPRSLKLLFKNLSLLSKVNLRELLKQMDRDAILSDVLSFASLSSSDRYEMERRYLSEKGAIDVFPYRQIRQLESVEGDFDKKAGMCYVMHGDKRLYFPKSYTLERAKEVYRNFIERENILGGGYTEKAPHQYQEGDFCINDGDIVLDAGCAEGLFSLDVAEKVKQILLFEPDPEWIGPLRYTFAPYAEKTTIIEKFISGEDGEGKTTLVRALKENIPDYEKFGIFLKMDIEGAEVGVIESSLELLQSNPAIKIACCTYHRANDAEKISSLIDNWNSSFGIGYSYSFSDGYMLPYLVDKLYPPYFRKGIIRITR